MAYRDPERQKKYAREWLKRFPEKARAAAKKWIHAYPEKRREQKRRERARDPGKTKAMWAKYHAAHPEVRRLTSVNYRARKLSAPGTFTARQWKDQMSHYRGRCGYCGVEAPLQADHRIPLSRGGSNDIGNIMPACARCNTRKARSTESEFRRRLINEELRDAQFMSYDWLTALLPTIDRYEAG